MMRSAIALWAKKATACLVLAIAVVMAAGVPVVAEASEVSPRIKNAQVLDTYKTFSNTLFVTGKYDKTYRLLTFATSYSLTSTDIISYTDGYYSGYYGFVTTYKCSYVTW